MWEKKIKIFTNKHRQGEEVTFWASDFPLKRRSSLWGHFPQTFSSHQKASLHPERTKRFSYPPIVRITELPDFSLWQKNIEQFKRAGFSKVILAKMTTVEFLYPLNPVDLFLYLQEKHPTAFVFAFVVNDYSAFVGASPELLFSLEGLSLKTEALAGTRAKEEANELTYSIKDLKEFSLVKRQIYDDLICLCHPFSLQDTFFLKQAGPLVHLSYPFEVTLKNPLSPSHLVNYLHPTSAIGGLPKSQALSFIQNHEPFDRGWYAGTVGFSDGNKSEIYVGIRSCLIEKNEMHIFTGCGIIFESDPKDEWDECNTKRKLFGLPL